MFGTPSPSASRFSKLSNEYIFYPRSGFPGARICFCPHFRTKKRGVCFEIEAVVANFVSGMYPNAQRTPQIPRTMQKHLLLVTILLSMTATLSAQNNKSEQERLPVKVEERSQEVHTIVEQMPVFPGGEAALLAYLAQHLKYPAQAIRDRVQGIVLLRFVVLENGRVGQVQTIKSLEPHCDAEAKRVVKSLPRFIPGRQGGKAVRVWYTLPIRFMIPEKTTKE